MGFFKDTNNNNNNIRSAVCSIFTVVAFSMKYDMVSDEVIDLIAPNCGRFVEMILKLLCAIGDYSLMGILAVFFCFLLYRYSFSVGKLKREECIIGILMALTLLFGASFELFGTTALLTNGLVQLLKTMIILAGYLLFFPQLVKGIRHYAAENFTLDKGFDLEDAVKYRRAIFAFLVVIWSVTLIAFFPGVFQGDTEDIIYMSYNYHTGLADSVMRIDENNMWVDHHSVLYTLILGAFVKGGRALFGNENAGIAVYTIMQGGFTAWVLAYSLFKLKGYGVNPLIRTCITLFFAFFPWIPRYALMATKDTLFADLLMLYILLIADIAIEKKEQLSRNQMLRLVIYSSLMFLLRKNGLYVAVLALPFLLMLNKRWLKSIAIVLLCIFAVKFVYSDVVLPACKIPDGSVSAALTVPLQQTSRYLHYYVDEVTQEEKDAIDAVANYDALSSYYEANRSDYAKSCWRKEADSSDLVNYMKVWAKMLFKHPMTYIAATANSNHGYFYPVVMDLSDFEKASNGSYQNINRDNYFDFHPTDNVLTRAARTVLRVCDNVLERTPLVNLLCTSAVYIWLLIFAWTRSIVNRDRKLLMLVIPLLMLMLTIITGPCNGNVYHRFTYPVAMCVPVVAAFGYRNGKEEEKADAE